MWTSLYWPWFTNGNRQQHHSLQLTKFAFMEVQSSNPNYLGFTCKSHPGGCDFKKTNLEVAQVFSLPLKETFVQCKGIQDSLGFWIPRRRFWIPGTGFRSSSVEIGFRIVIVCGIPNSLSCIVDSKRPRILDSTKKTFPASGFHKQ